MIGSVVGPATATVAPTAIERARRDLLVHDAYAAHAASLERYLRVITRDEAAAEDLTQESFLRLAREIEAGRTPDNIGGWLHRVGFNLATSRGRRAQVAQRMAGALVRHETERSPEEATLEAERNGALRDALASLPPTDREAVVLAAHGWRGPEIAARIGRTELATRTLLCRARGRLRATLLAQGLA